MYVTKRLQFCLTTDWRISTLKRVAGKDLADFLEVQNVSYQLYCGRVVSDQMNYLLSVQWIDSAVRTI